MEKRIVSLFLVLFLIFTLVGCGSDENLNNGENEQAETMVLKFIHGNTIDHPKGKAAQLFADLVNEKSDGRITVEVYPSSQLYNEIDGIEALQAGVIHFMMPYSGKMTGHSPNLQVLQMPFLFDSVEDYYAFADSQVADRVLASLEDIELKGLALWDQGFFNFMNHKKPIKTIDDFTGLKFRIPGGKITEKQYELFNASAITLPGNEVYTALQQGTVDGIENSLTNIKTMKWFEVGEYLSISNHSLLINIFMTNNDWYENLSEEDKAIIDEATAEVTEFVRKEAKHQDAENLTYLENETDLIINTISKTEIVKMKEAVMPLYKEFEDIIGKDILDDILNKNY